MGMFSVPGAILNVKVRDQTIFVFFVEPTFKRIRYSENGDVQFNSVGCCLTSLPIDSPFVNSKLRLSRITYVGPGNWKIDNILSDEMYLKR